VIRFLYSHEKLDRFVEGDAVWLIDKGKLRPDRMRKELITIAELEEAAHKQGFASLDLIDRAVLEPGGSLCFIGKAPQPEELRFQEVLQRLDAIATDLAALKQKPV